MREFVWLDALPLALINGSLANPSYTWITTGHLGEPLLLTDAAGAVVSSVTRDPWGNRVLLAGGDPLDLGYPGQWRDPATGLFQNHHRDYDPMTGRYIEADPLGLGGGSNLYGYVGGDPINAVDPEGRYAARVIFPLITGALMNVNLQLLENGGRLDCIDWSAVGRDALIGGALGGIGGLVAPRILGASNPILRRVPGFSRPIKKPKIAETPLEYAQRLGKGGEAAAGVSGSKVGTVINGRLRFPDELTPTLVKEVKNVARQGWTRQLRDYADLAAQNGVPFELWVRQNTILSSHLRTAAQTNEVTIIARLLVQ